MPTKLGAILLPDPERMLPVGMLIARVATGLILAPHGFGKLFGGTAALAHSLADKGMPLPFVLAVCAGLSEFVGGLLTAVGLFTRPAAASLAFSMTVAWLSMHTSSIAAVGTGKGGTFEYPFYLSVIALAIVVGGPGKLSLDAKLFGKG